MFLVLASTKAMPIIAVECWYFSFDGRDIAYVRPDAGKNGGERDGMITNVVSLEVWADGVRIRPPYGPPPSATQT